MLRPILALAIALTSPVPAGFAQPDRAQTHGGNRAAEGRDAGELPSFDDLHARIDRAEGVSEEKRQRLHQTVDAVKRESAKVAEANALVDELQAKGLIAHDPAEKEKIEAEVKRQLDRVAAGRGTMDATRQSLEAEIATSSDLSREQKARVESILKELKNGDITPRESLSMVTRMFDQNRSEIFTVVFIIIVLLVVFRSPIQS